MLKELSRTPEDHPLQLCVSSSYLQLTLGSCASLGAPPTPDELHVSWAGSSLQEVCANTAAWRVSSTICSSCLNTPIISESRLSRLISSPESMAFCAFVVNMYFISYQRGTQHYEVLPAWNQSSCLQCHDQRLGPLVVS